MRHLRFEQLEPRLPLHGEALFLTSHETIPNYGADPDTSTIADGNWFDPAIWSNGIPDPTDDVHVGHDVVIGPFMPCGVPTQEPFAAAEDINVDGKLSFATDADTKLAVQTLTVMGRLEIGTEERPVTANTEIIFRDSQIDTAFDPQQLGHGLIVLGDATFETNGRDRTSFVRVTSVPKAGDRTLTLSESPAGWLPGDELWIADTRDVARGFLNYERQERMEIVSVVGNVVTLKNPLLFNHLGQGDFLPHVAHLSSNIVFRSENPNGTRGHVIITGRADVRVHDAVFDELGRTTFAQLDNTHLGPEREINHVGTNQIGRYSFHMHHVYGPLGLTGPQFELSGNVFTDGRKWGVAIHDTSYGLVSNNVIVGMQGAGIAFEDASEFGNQIEHNFIGGIAGSGQGTQGRSDPNDIGHEGAGIWGRGLANNFVDNVVANAWYGNVFWTRFFGATRLPAFPGADTRVDWVPGWSTQQLGHEFRGNEIYGTSTAYLWLGVGQGAVATGTPGSTFTAVDNNSWFTTQAIDISYSGTILISGGTIRSRWNALRSQFTAYIGIDGVQFYGWTGVGITSPLGHVRNSYFATPGGQISAGPGVMLENNTYG